MKHIIIFIFFCLAALTIQQTVPINFIPKNNTYYRLTTLWQGDGKSLDVVADGTNNKIQLSPTGDYQGQYWKFTFLDTGSYRITNAWQGDNKSLQVMSDGKTVQLVASGPNTAQVWKISKASDIYYRLTNLWQTDAKSLDGPVMAATGSYSGQNWKFTQIIPSNLPKFVPKPHVFYSLTTSLSGNSKKLAINGLNVLMADAVTASLPYIYWRFDSIGNDYYRISNSWEGTSKNLQIIKDGINNQVRLGTPSSNTAQIWRIINIGDGFYRIISIYQGDKKSLGEAVMAGSSNSPSQYWKFTEFIPNNKFTPKPNSSYRLTTLWQGDGVSLGVVDDANDNKIQLSATVAQPRQYWEFISIGGDFYRLTNILTVDNKCLQAMTVGNLAFIMFSNSYFTQYWKVKHIQASYYRISTAMYGDKRSLDGPVLADSGEFSGQYWKITQLILP